MKQTLFTFLLSIYCLVSLAQSFEGEVIYKCSYKSKIANLSDEKFTAIAGDTLKYYMKAGDYRSDCNGTYLEWQIYINADNKLYNKTPHSETILWDDGAINKDSILNIKLNKNTTEILGYKCDELIFNCTSGIQKYYFTSKFPIDSKLYSKQLYQNWYAYLEKAHAIPLKMIIDNSVTTVEMTATSITPMKLDGAMFILPSGSHTAKRENY